MTESRKNKDDKKPQAASESKAPPVKNPPQEVGGRGGLDPARYGDWEINGKCVDF